MRVAFTVLLVIAASNSVRAAEPALTAGGLYYVGSDDTPATLAFEVLPWTADVHQVRGYGRAVVGKDDPRELHFEIIGTYRPTRNQTARGMFVQRSADGSRTTTVAWQGLYVPKDGSFQWLATVGGQLVPLPAAQFSGVLLSDAGTEAAAGPAATGDRSVDSAKSPPVNAPLGNNRPIASGDTKTSSRNSESTNVGPAAAATPGAATNASGSANSATGSQSTTRPSPRTALFSKYPRAADEEGLDFGEVMAEAVAALPDQIVPAAKPRKTKPLIVDGAIKFVAPDGGEAAATNFIKTATNRLADEPPLIRNRSEMTDATRNIGIINELTDIGAGNDSSKFGSPSPNEMIDLMIRDSRTTGGTPAVAGSTNSPPATAGPSTTATTTTPAAAPSAATNAASSSAASPAPSSPPTTTPPPSAPAGRTVPNVVGLSFENATNAIWAAGLTVGGVDNLGAAQDPAKAERIIAQTPPAGSPYPADRSVRLQWYASVEKLQTEGFRDGDGVKVDVRFADSKARAGGRITQHVGSIGDEKFVWAVWQLAEPQAREEVANLRKSFAAMVECMKPRADSSSELVITEQQGSPTETIFIFECYQRVFVGDARAGFTAHTRLVEYRGFLIYVHLNEKVARQVLSPVAASMVENSKRLIDLRFPPKN